MWFLSGVSLQHRITISVTIGLVLVFSILGYLGLQAIEQSTQMIFAERIINAKTVANVLDSFLKRSLDDLERYANSNLANSENLSPAVQRELLARARADLPVFQYVGLADAYATGVLIDPYDPDLVSHQHLGVQESLATLKPSITSFEMVGKAQRVMLAVPIRNSEGRLTGFIYGILEPTHQVPGLHQLMAMGDGVYAEVVDVYGYVVASNEPEHLLEPHTAIGSLLPLIEAKTPTAMIHEVPQEGKQASHVVAFAPLSTVPWGVIVEQSTGTALALPGQLRQTMLLLGLIIVPAVAFLAWLDVRSVVRPLESLTGAAERIAGGNLEEPVRIVRGDEIGLLARAFEVMRIKLKASLREIEQWNRELENRVQERTREAERRNRELSAVNAVATTVSRSLNLDEILEAALDKVLDIASVEAGAIRLLEDENSVLRARVWRGMSDLFVGPGGCSMSAACICSEVLRSAQPAVIEDLAAFPEACHVAHRVEGFSSLAVIPLQSKDRIIGILYVASISKRGFPSDELQLLTALGSQVSIAVENARLYEGIQQKEELRGQLLAKVIAAQEEERKRIARELHDEPAQALSALIMSIQAAEDALPAALDREKKQLERAKVRTVQAVKDIRKLILDLRPTALDDLGLVPAIRWYAENTLQGAGTSVRLQVSGEERRLPSQVETSLFRITQEAVNNVAKYSRASECTITLEFGEARVAVTVEDNGDGFDMEEILKSKDQSRGLGLAGMKERATLLGGEFAVYSKSGGGTQIRVEAPVSSGGVVV